MSSNSNPPDSTRPTLRTTKWTLLAEAPIQEEQDQRLSREPALHASPGSTLVAAMGPYWQKYVARDGTERSCYDDVYEMCQYTFQEAGYHIFFKEFPDLCFEPFDSLGSMRNMAYMAALRGGYEYILYVDNDCLPEKDTLLKLIGSHVPIVGPHFRFADGHHYDLSIPQLEMNHGLALAGSTVLTCVLFRTSVFAPWWGGHFWSNAIGDDEGRHFDQLAGAGHQLYIQTDAQVFALKPPHFPLEQKWGGRGKDQTRPAVRISSSYPPIR